LLVSFPDHYGADAEEEAQEAGIQGVQVMSIEKGAPAL
jgi:hypothetical protein